MTWGTLIARGLRFHWRAHLGVLLGATLATAILAGALAVGDSVRCIFIRAPYVSSAGPNVDVLGRYHDRIVAVRQGPILASAFHPELTPDTSLHGWFLESCFRSQKSEVRSQTFEGES